MEPTSAVILQMHAQGGCSQQRYTFSCSSGTLRTAPAALPVYLLCPGPTATRIAAHARSPVVTPVVHCRCVMNSC